MTRRQSIPIWMCLLLSGFVGCASLRDDDPTDFAFPGDGQADQGFLTRSTDQFVASAKASIGLGPDEQVARERFEQAMQQYRNAGQLQGAERQKAFDAAARAFASAATRWPKSSVEEDSLFYRAESLFFADRYPKAEEGFAQIVSQYQTTKHIDTISKRRFQIAKYWLDHHDLKQELPISPNLLAKDRPTFDKFGNAIKVLENIRLDDPTGELADDATMLAATACFESGRYYRADELLEDLRHYFPNSKHQYNAHLLGLRCKIQLYQGPNYDSGPLDAAEELVKQMRRQFPQESRSDNEFLASIYKDIRMNHAIREMNLAKYRDRRKEYRAARAQYARVARDFGDTSLAKDASERLAQLGGEPDLPPQRLAWLARVFPSDEPEQPLLATKPGTSSTR